jgi:valyl-tRNA synthetase
MTILVPLADIIDPAAESAKLEKEITRLKGVQEQITAKLANSGFTDRAPAEVVQKERERLHETEATINKLEEQHKRILKLIP